MKYLKPTFLGATLIVIIFFISKYIGSLFFPKEERIPEQIMGGFLALLIIICVICLCYAFGKIIELFIKP